MSSAVNRTLSGSGTASDPYVYHFNFEFSRSSLSAFPFPGLDDQYACYMHIDPRVDGNTASNSADIFSPGILTLVSSVVPSDDNDLASEPTSRAIYLNGLSILLTLIGMMSYYF